MGTEKSDNGNGNMQPDGGRHSYVAAECEGCGRRFKLRRWRKGIQCPKCRKADIAPLPADGGAVDYCIADRSSGHAQADIRFAQWTKWAGLITPRQYDQAFVNQNRRLKENPQPIHKIMIEEGWITEKQAIRLLEYLCNQRPDADDRWFADAVIDSGLAGKEEVEKALQLQRKIAKKANETPPLCQIMLEKHVLGESKVVSLLRKLQNKGQGPLSTICEITGKTPRIKKRKRAVQGTAGGRYVLKQVVVIASLFLLAAGVWYWQGREAPYRFIAVCDSCGETNRLKWEPNFPLECPTCRVEAAYPARICEKEHLFPASNPYHHQPCPVCGSSNVRVPKEEDLPGEGR